MCCVVIVVSCLWCVVRVCVVLCVVRCASCVFGCALFVACCLVRVPSLLDVCGLLFGLLYALCVVCCCVCSLFVGRCMV